MKFFRSIAAILIFALATSPALAAICATTCASGSVMASIHVNNMDGMKNCHEGSMNKSQQKPGTEHKSCAMGAGCHFSQVTPVESSSKYFFAAIATISFPGFTPAGKSVDLSPPLKPPA